MAVYTGLHGKLQESCNLTIPLEGAFLIARAPEEIQQEAIELAAQGEKMSIADVKKAIADANEAALKKTEQQIARCLMDQSCTSRPRFGVHSENLGCVYLLD